MGNALIRRSGSAPSPELANLRDQIGAAVARYPRHPEIKLNYREYGGVRCLELTPGSPVARMVYFHGGGFRIGSPEIAVGFASRLAARSGCRIIIPFYGLAPENPFPGALLDGEAVVDALDGEEPLLLGGDSAGGNLAAVLAPRFADRIKALLLLSPWLDLRVAADSYISNGESDQMFSQQSAREAAALYLQGHSPLDADVSPLLGGLDLIPPCLIVVGSGEVLLDDALQFAQGLAERHRLVSLEVLPGMSHVEPLLRPNSDHTRTVLMLAGAFVRRVGNEECAAPQS